MAGVIHLGLIGDNIRLSRAWQLHQLAGELCGLKVVYENLIPAELGKDFDAVFDHCMGGGFRAINITHPYKETVMRRLATVSDAARMIGAANVVVFDDDGPAGYNTDASGFEAAFRANFPGETPGAVAMIGAGGAGRAVGYALLMLGATELRVIDIDGAKAAGLVEALKAVESRAVVRHCQTIDAAAVDADGLVNCTPVGMDGYPGTPIPPAHLRGKRWVFDAIYTPEETVFVQAARAAGLPVMTGFELFFHQGVDGFAVFTGRDVPPEPLRRALREA